MSKKIVGMPQWFTYDRKMQQSMAPYSQYLIECALGYESEVLLGNGSRLDPECTAEVFVMNTPAHGYSHMSVSVDMTRDLEALRKMVGALEEAKAKAVRRILEIEAEEFAE